MIDKELEAAEAKRDEEILKLLHPDWTEEQIKNRLNNIYLRRVEDK